MGREEVHGEADVVHHDPETFYNSLNIARLSRMNLPAEDFVALVGGSQTLGFRGEGKKGHQSRWTMNPYVFDNTYFQQLLLGHDSKYFSTEHDHKLVHEHRHWVEAYAQDQNLFFASYAKAHVNLSELNAPHLYGEMNNDVVEGGYVEKSRLQLFAGWFNRDQQITDVDMVRIGDVGALATTGGGDHHDDDHHDDHHDDHDDDHHDDHDDHHDDHHEGDHHGDDHKDKHH